MQEAFTAQRLAGYLDPLNETVAQGLTKWPPVGQIHFERRIRQDSLNEIFS